MRSIGKLLFVFLLILCFIGSSVVDGPADNVSYTPVYQYTISSDTVLTATSGSIDASSPTGDYTDTHSINDVFFGGTGTSISVTLWVQLSEAIGGFNYSAYWNASGASAIHIYDNSISDWTLLDGSPNGDDSPLTWDNGTIENEDYYNSTSVGFKFYTASMASVPLYVDYFQIETFEVTQWNVINTVEFIFPVGWDPAAQFGYDAFFIFLGLIMIPVSTMYLVRGGRKEMSTDKLFFGLIIFAVGFGFLIGGILP